MKWTEGAGGFTPVSVGTHVARCISLIDLGTQQEEFEGKARKVRKVMIIWEVPDETGTDGKPLTISSFYTQSLDDKAKLRAHLWGWRGRDFTPEELKGFDAKNILGKPCLLSVVDKNGKTRVGSVSALPKGTHVVAQVHPSTYFSFDEYDATAFESLSDPIKNMIRKAAEFGAGAPSMTNKPRIDDDDVPF